MSVIRAAAKATFAAADLVMKTPGGPRVLIYHQVGAGLGRQMEVGAEDFRRQMEWLAANRDVVSLDEAIARWGESGSERLIVLTFDDGYEDVFTEAFPTLAELGFPFTLFLATESIETGKALGPSPGADPLDWGMVREMSFSGRVTVGAHTHTHRDLRHADHGEVENELSRSDGLIEERLGVAPRHFAYPWGYWSAVADELVRKRYASAVLGGTPRPKPAPDPHLLHRYPVQLSDSFAFFERRLTGGLRLEEQVRRMIRGYSGP